MNQLDLDAVKQRARGLRADILQWDSGRPEGEVNDCTVRALSNVTRLTYEQAHAEFAAAGRKPRQGWNFYSVAVRHGAEPVTVTGRTLRAVLPQLTSGFYVVRTRGHVFAVIDGRAIDTARERDGRHVLNVFRFPDPTNGA